MATITLATLRDYWKGVYDWVKGTDAVSKPKVSAELTGSSIALPVDLQYHGLTSMDPLPTTMQLIECDSLTTTPLTAGASFSSGYASNKALALGLTVTADTLVTISLRLKATSESSYATASENHCNFTVRPRGTWAFYVPPFSVPGESRIWTIKNPTSVNQTYLAVDEIKLYSPIKNSQSLIVQLANNLAIRDTNGHTYSTDPQHMFPADLGLLGAKNCTLFVNNTLDQPVSVTVWVANYDGWAYAYTPFTVASNSVSVKTKADLPCLDFLSDRFYISVKSTTAPTTGTVTAVLTASVGG